MALTSGTRFGSYEIVAALGAGGMGEVYRARDINLGRDVALSTLSTAKKTKLEDLVLVCSNCHRMIHRERPWLDAALLRTLVGGTRR